MNGRTNGDYLGQMTCYNYKGSSVVDCFIIDDSLFKSILTFKVSHLIPGQAIQRYIANGGWKTK